MLCEDEGRDWSDSQQTTRSQEWGMEHVSPSLEGANPEDTLVLDFWFPEQWDN